MATPVEFSDLEELLDAVEGILTADLNTCIGSINTKKGPPIVLDTFVADEFYRFFVGTLATKKALWINVEAMEIRTETNVNSAKETVILPIIIMIPDSMNPEDYTKSLRYMTVLKNVFKINARTLLNVSTIMIESVMPFTPAAIDPKTIFINKLACGIVLNITYA